MIFKHIQKQQEEKKESNVDWTIENNVLTICGSGEMQNWSKGNTPWFEQRDTIAKVCIQENITSIGNYAFYGCNNLQDVEIPNNVSKIGDSVFEDCSELVSIIIPDSVEEIGCNTFNGCFNLKNVFLPKHLKQIGSNMFFYCKRMNYIKIPNDVIRIDIGAFYGCKNLINIRIPDSVKDISRAFVLCNSLKQIHLPEAITNIDGAFLGCSRLFHIEIPDQVESIGSFTFANCSSLNNITIAARTKRIEADAFRECNNLKTVYYPGTVEDWNKIEIMPGNECLTNATILYKTMIEQNTTDPINQLQEYEIMYYPDINSENSSQFTTIGIYGERTETKKIEELGFHKEGYIFEGWRAYRDEDDKWFVRKLKGSSSWQKLAEGKLQSDCVYSLLGNGRTLMAPAKSGTVKLFAQWGGKMFEVVYHENDNASASKDKTIVNYGTRTKTLTLEELHIKNDQQFLGWRLWREIDGKWRVKSTDGKTSWRALKKGKIEEGYEYVLFKEGQSLIKAATSGKVHFYAQWKNKEKVERNET